MQLPNELVQNILSLEDQIRNERVKLHQFKQHKTKIQTEKSELESSFGFRETYFNGGLGGNRENVLKARELSRQLETYNTEVESAQRLIENRNDDIKIRTINYLQKNDEDFNTLKSMYQNIRKVKKSLDHYKLLIEDTIVDIDDADETSIFDLDSKNGKRTSYWDVSEIEEAVDHVMDYTQIFQRKIDDYNSTLKNTYAPAQIKEKISGEGLKLDFELVHDGFDFTSMFAKQKETGVQEALADLLMIISDTSKDINEQYKRAEHNLNQYVWNVRSSINKKKE